ncbi:MAG TPA: tryptophan halogenase family protein [Burkholderiaceae bacterium]|jgi:tryptophan halogenase|nr:tryptophan halogenase family protein [Burkholderiaceae bacterium]
MTDTRVKNIVIVGGGTAGWMTAAAMSKLLNGIAKITLIESDEISTVGVGESTIPKIKLFNKALGIDENDFVKQTQGTFKLGIEFINWGRIGDAYMHSFGDIGRDMGLIEFYHYWLRAHQTGKVPDLQAFSLNNVAAKRDKFMRSIDAENSPLSRIANAFHFDAGLYARYLRQYAEARGVIRTEGKIVDTLLRDGDGFVEAVVMQNGQKISGDLFIDCSGFRGLLIEQALKTGYDDWTHWLPCDRAIAVPCESAGALTPYTKATARSAGWQWRIPLQHRIGNGHVYSSRFMSDDEATAILLKNLDAPPLADPRMLKFTTGKRKKGWNKNVVAIGLSSGFMEPLESTSIHMVQSAIARLLSFFPNTEFNQADIDEYNRKTDFEAERIRDFLVLHYKATQRTDSEFWNHCRTMEIPPELERKIKLFQSNGRISRDSDELFDVVGWLQVMHGQGIKPNDYHPLANLLTPQENQQFMVVQKSLIDQAVEAMPMHADFIAKHCAAMNKSALMAK